MASTEIVSQSLSHHWTACAVAARTSLGRRESVGSPQSCQMTENKNARLGTRFYRTERQLSLALGHPKFAPLRRDPSKLLRWRRMEDSVKKLQAEFVDLLRKQVDALELDAYVGLTDEERSKYHERQERIRDLDERLSGSSDRAA
jgi:hypothetical protein